jgi:hypothetical protein
LNAYPWGTGKTITTPEGGLYKYLKSLRRLERVEQLDKCRSQRHENN